MRSYQDAAAGYTPLQQALLDNQRATDEAVKRQELGATEEQLASSARSARRTPSSSKTSRPQLADLMRSHEDANYWLHAAATGPPGQPAL